MPTFSDFVSGLQLVNFSAAELLVNTERPTNSVPPEAIWDNIGPTITALQTLRTGFGGAISINSVYRAHNYNKHIQDAARLSQHVGFNAIDFTLADRAQLPALHARLIDLRDTWITAPRVFTRAAVHVESDLIPSRPLEWRESNGRRQFLFRGGVKLYNTFIHIDTRGVNSNWG